MRLLPLRKRARGRFGMVYRTTRRMAERKEARRKKLLSAAIGIFGRKGYHAATVPMIVRAANSSVGSFYFYFRNKEDVSRRRWKLWASKSLARSTRPFPPPDPTCRRRCARP